MHLLLALALLALGTPALAQVPACPAGPFFEVAPLDAADYHALRPLGFLSSPIHVVPSWHSSFSRQAPGETRPPARVVFPGAAVVQSIWVLEFQASGARSLQIRFAPCDQVTAYFNHLGTLSARLAEALAAAPGQCSEYFDGSGNVRNCRHAVSVPVAAGEEAGLSDASAGVDFGLIDYRRAPAVFANAAHYTRDFFYYASPLDGFTPALREVLRARLGSYDGSVWRTAEPREGTHAQDVPGTAQGTWFTPGTSFVTLAGEETMAALAYDYVEPAQPLFSFGTRVSGLPAGLASFTPEVAGRVNRTFAAVAADGQVYCYDRFLGGRSLGGLPLRDPGGMLLLALSTPTTLRLEVQGGAGARCGEGPWAFTAAAVLLER